MQKSALAVGITEAHAKRQHAIKPHAASYLQLALDHDRPRTPGEVGQQPSAPQQASRLTVGSSGRVAGKQSNGIARAAVDRAVQPCRPLTANSVSAMAAVQQSHVSQAQSAVDCRQRQQVRSDSAAAAQVNHRSGTGGKKSAVAAAVQSSRPENAPLHSVKGSIASIKQQKGVQVVQPGSSSKVRLQPGGYTGKAADCSSPVMGNWIRWEAGTSPSKVGCSMPFMTPNSVKSSFSLVFSVTLQCVTAGCIDRAARVSRCTACYIGHRDALLTTTQLPALKLACR